MNKCVTKNFIATCKYIQVTDKINFKTKFNN